MTSLFYIVFFVVLAMLVVRMIRYGGATGMMVGARTRERLGMIEGKAAGKRRINLVVHRLDGNHPIGIQCTGHAYMSVERMAASLSREDARRLADALETAAAEQGGS